MENISFFLKVYFVATFQLYETTCSSFPNTKHFPNKECLRSLKKPLFQDPSVQELQLLDFLFCGSNNSKYWQTLPHWHRSLLNKGGSKSPPHKGGFQSSTSSVYTISSSSPLSSQAVVYSILNTKWWPSCVTFRMGKSKTNAQILKTAIKLLAQMRKWVAKPNQSNSYFLKKIAL